MIHLRTLLIIVLVYAIGLPASAQNVIYKWQDENGEVHYSQTPPTHVEAEVVKQAPPPPGAGKADERLRQEMKAFDERYKKRKEAEHTRITAAKDQAIRKQNCSAARQNLANLENRGQSRVKQGDTYVRLSEDERQQRIGEAKKLIEDYCK